VCKEVDQIKFSREILPLGLCELSNEELGSIMAAEFSDYLREYQLLKEGSLHYI
jgi:hypothetical protein